MKRYKEALECLKTAKQIDEKKDYTEEIRKIMIRVEFFVAMERAIDTWGEAPDSLDRILQATRESFDNITTEYKRSSAPPPRPQKPASPNPRPQAAAADSEHYEPYPRSSTSSASQQHQQQQQQQPQRGGGVRRSPFRRFFGST